MELMQELVAWLHANWVTVCFLFALVPVSVLARNFLRSGGG